MKTRRTQKNFSRQMYAVTNLQTCRDGYEITEFKTEEWAGGTVFVKRTRKPNHVANCAYHESFTVGVRGAVTALRSDFY